MTVDVQVGSPGSAAQVTIEGPVALGGFIQGLEELVGHPQFAPGTDVLVDLVGHVHQTTSADIRSLAQALMDESERLAGTRLAVAVSQTVSYGMVRMLQTFLEDAPFDVAVFRDLQEAKEWLGV